MNQRAARHLHAAARAASRGAREPRRLRRPDARARVPLRSRAPRLCALRRPGRAPARHAGRARRARQRAHPAGAGRRAGRTRRLFGELSRGAPRRIATIAAGYADGVFRHASATNDAPGGAVAIRGKRAPIVGRVSMDLITVDVTDLGDRRRRAATGPISSRPSSPSRAVGAQREDHRLRGADAARAPLPPRLSRRRRTDPRMAKLEQDRPSSARTAAPSRRAGRASAPRARSGTRSSRRRTPSRRRAPGSRARRQRPRHRARRASRARTGEAPRFSTGIAELDRVTGGGIVPGSALLIGGEPGIGKSTLLLQLAAALARAGRRAIYFSGEEAAAQVRLRAERLGLADAPVELACETNLANILATLERRQAAPISSSSIPSRRCGPTRSRPRPAPSARCAPRRRRSIRYAKTRGQRAAARRPRHQGRPDRRPQGDRAHGRHRAVFRRRPRPPLPHPARGQEPLRRRPTRSACSRWRRRACARSRTRPSCSSATATRSSPGAAVFAGMEGTRPLLVEIQALVAPSGLGTPRRAVVGWDANRLSMLLAVLEARCGVSFAGHDVYLNVAGGLKITEPAADLAAAAALLSSLSGVAIPRHAVYFGEVSLSGAVQRHAAHGAAPQGGAEARVSPGRHARAAASSTRAGIEAASSSRIAHLKELADGPPPCD